MIINFIFKAFFFIKAKMNIRILLKNLLFLRFYHLGCGDLIGLSRR